MKLLSIVCLVVVAFVIMATQFVLLSKVDVVQECNRVVTEKLYRTKGGLYEVKDKYLLANEVVMLSYGPKGTNKYTQNTYCGVVGETVVYSPDPARLMVMLGR